MKKLLLSLAAATAFSAAGAQSIITSTFDTKVLPNTDTAYVNYSQPGSDVGFIDGSAYYHCVYDTGFGVQYWSYGFAYSNKKDSVTGGYTNEYSARTGIGHGGTANYAVAYGVSNTVRLLNSAIAADGMYITNTTLAYNSMRDGDAFAKKFGGASGADPDYFRMIVKAYRNGVLKPDSVVSYLADYRGPGGSDYILKSWQWVDLKPLGGADSLEMMLQSSDNGAFGMNTPAYFAMDDLTVLIPTGVKNTEAPLLVSLFPNPAGDNICISSLDAAHVPAIEIFDALGRQVLRLQDGQARHEISVAAWPAGAYTVRASGPGGMQVIRFVKQQR